MIPARHPHAVLYSIFIPLTHFPRMLWIAEDERKKLDLSAPLLVFHSILFNFFPHLCVGFSIFALHKLIFIHCVHRSVIEALSKRKALRYHHRLSHILLTARNRSFTCVVAWAVDSVASMFYRFDIPPYSIGLVVREREHTRCSNFLSLFSVRMKKTTYCHQKKGATVCWQCDYIIPINSRTN